MGDTDSRIKYKMMDNFVGGLALTTKEADLAVPDA